MQPLPAVICGPEKHLRKVDRLVQHCRELDGTELTVITVADDQDKEFIRNNPGNTFAKLQAYSLRREALHFKERPFIHLEPDSIPLKPGWAAAIASEYYRLGKPFMLSSDSHPPGDLVGGIGVYSGDTHFLIPYDFERDGWDLWMIRNMREMIAFSPLIQHKYALYPEGSMFKSRDLYFPQDGALIRSDALIFHRDARQGLIPGTNSERRFAHSGCIGDTIAALPSIRQLGGGDLIMTQKNNPRVLRGERYEFLRPLLEAQPYLKSVSWEEHPKDIDYDFTDFRTAYKGDITLAQTQARYIGVDLDESPWLHAPPDERSKGRIVIARSPRYQNYGFPWRRIARHHMQRLLFLGLPEERQALESRIGAILPTVECRDALEMARLISGADMFIGNQSSPFWMAAGLGKKMIQETYQPNPDSSIIRPNAFYWNDEIDSKALLDFIRQV